MLARVLSSAVFGIDAYVVEVEVDIAQGLPAFATVGLPEGAVKESKDRVKAAVKNCGYDFPARRITVNLAPADIKKEGRPSISPWPSASSRRPRSCKRASWPIILFSVSSPLTDRLNRSEAHFPLQWQQEMQGIEASCSPGQFKGSGGGQGN